MNPAAKWSSHSASEDEEPNLIVHVVLSLSRENHSTWIQLAMVTWQVARAFGCYDTKEQLDEKSL